jgi:hypothetical protein
MLHVFKPFIITDEMKKDFEDLSKKFFKKLSKLKSKYHIPEIQVMNSPQHGISYDILSGIDSIEQFSNNHPE